MKKLTGAETRLEKAVQRIVNRHAVDYEDGADGFMQDLEYGGCISGLVGELIYYTDTLPWYKRHREEINAMLRDLQEDTGMPAPEILNGWDKDDPLALDTQNQNLLAWFSFEETARRLYER